MMQPMQRFRAEEGLTLIELLIVIALVGVVSAIALPILFSTVADAQAKANSTSQAERDTFTTNWGAAGYTVEAGSATILDGQGNSTAGYTVAVDPATGKVVAQIKAAGAGGNNGGGQQVGPQTYSYNGIRMSGMYDSSGNLLGGGNSGNFNAQHDMAWEYYHASATTAQYEISLTGSDANATTANALAAALPVGSTVVLHSNNPSVYPDYTVHITSAATVVDQSIPMMGINMYAVRFSAPAADWLARDTSANAGFSSFTVTRP